MPNRPCLVCGTPTPGSRCPTHPNPNRVARDRYPYRKARRSYLNAWIQTHGPVCPGAADLNHRSHQSNALTVDHIDGNANNNSRSNWRVLCNQANAKRGQPTR